MRLPPLWSDATPTHLPVPSHHLIPVSRRCHRLAGVIGDTVYGLKESENETYFTVLNRGSSVKKEIIKHDRSAIKQEVKPELKPDGGTFDPTVARSQLRKYLQLDVLSRSVQDVTWSADHKFEAVVRNAPGVRVVRTPVLEGVVTLMGSANNNISRNTKMVSALCSAFPENELAVVCGIRHFRFPSLLQLLTLDEAAWWDLGWGYRSPRMVQACHQLLNAGGEPWLTDLAQAECLEARESLLELAGVGPKVADCVCLFSLGMHSVVPLDTRTAKLYLRKEMSAQNYLVLQGVIQAQFGDYAGWAFLTLFVAELHGRIDTEGYRVLAAKREGVKTEIKAEMKVEVKTEVKIEAKTETIKSELTEIKPRQGTKRECPPGGGRASRRVSRRPDFFQ